MWDMAVTEILAGYYQAGPDGRRPPESLYGSLKMWAHLRRQGIPVARCTVERLMRANAWRGVTRAKKLRTTVADPAATRAPDLVNRHFGADRPDELHVADFTYVRMLTGFGYSAFVIDAFAGLIVGWECSTAKDTAFVERALRSAAAERRRQGRPLAGGTIHHSDAGSQYTAVHFGETLMLEGLTPSIGSVGVKRSTTRWPKPPSACTRPSASGPAPRFVEGRSPVSANSSTSPPAGGALVQHRPAHAPARPKTTRRNRSRVLH